MMPAQQRGRFGTVRKLASGRYQVRYYGPDGKRHSAPRTFERKSDATKYLALVEAKITREEWADPDRGRVLLGEYADKWISERAGLRPSTVQLYRRLLNKYVRPELGEYPLNRLTTAGLREWRATLLHQGIAQTIVAKSYRLLRAVLTTAVEDDRLLVRNPCRIRGADRETPEERPVLTIAQVFQLADSMPRPQLRTFILVAAMCSLRWGEITGLRRCDVEEDGSRIHVTSQLIELPGEGLTRGAPKSRAGRRTVTVPQALRADLVRHLAEYVGPNPDDLVFTMQRGGPMRRGNFNPATNWKKNVTAIGVPDLHFHDLRHTGNTLAAATGSSLRDLMTRMGHDSPRAAMIYQHATNTADQLIADGLSLLIERHRGDGHSGHVGGTHGEETDASKDSSLPHTIDELR
jgi:integrase